MGINKLIKSNDENTLLIAFVLLSCVLHGQRNGSAISGMYDSGNTAAGYASTAMGEFTNASGYGILAIGYYNTIDATANPTGFSSTNRALVIGNSTSESRSDAMTVLFDGTTIIAGDLTVNSDARLKSNISSLGNTLSMLKMLDGKTYNLKSNESKEKIGLLARDVQKVFPQLVRSSKDDQATLSLNYQGLIPVLINAVNEQQGMIEDYEARLDKQQKQIDKLIELVDSLMKKE